MEEAGISEKELSVRTVSRFLNSKGYHYLQSRKKGQLSVADLTNKLRFARKMKRDYPHDVWTTKIGFYLDATSYTFKTNPLDQAHAPKGRIWRKPSEGMAIGCLAKGRKEGTGGKYVKLIVGNLL